jgi:hypothetical protein
MLLRGLLQFWLDSPSLGGAMVVKLLSVDLGGLCNLCKLQSLLYIFYRPILFSIS